MEDAKKSFLTIKLIHFAIVAGLIMFACIVILSNFKKISLTPAFDNPIAIVTSIFCIGSIGLSLAIPVIFTRIASLPKDARSALMQYQVFCITRWAVIEGGALFCCIVTFMTSNTLAVLFLVILTALLIYRYPSQKEFVALMEKRKQST